MDIYCTTCGEPWDVDFVLHEADPEDFVRSDGAIYRCLCCQENRRTLTEETRERLAAIRAIAPLFDDDLDGLAAFLDDVDVIDPK